MRINEQNQMSSYSTSQFIHMNFRNGPEKNDYMLKGDSLAEYGLVGPANIKALKRHLGRS